MPNGKTLPMQFLRDPMRAQMDFLPIKVEYPYRRIAGGILVLVSEKGKGEEVEVSVESKVVPTGSLQADSVVLNTLADILSETLGLKDRIRVALRIARGK